MRAVGCCLLGLALCLPQASLAQLTPDCVVLLHGLARSSSSMSKMKDALEMEGFRVANVGYPSTEMQIEELADIAIPLALEYCDGSPSVNFVTHSMGGILVRQYLSQNNIPNLHRVVMLGPPNQGSEVVDVLREVPGFHLINGDAGLQLGTGEKSVPLQLPPANFEVGIIAGDSSINLLLSTMIPGDDDGKVSVENTKLEGMRDHLVVDVSHPLIMRDDDVIAQVIYFLRFGYFNPLAGGENY
jgi:pimeloyl-ACP methyl ester carboxylesterase